MSVHGRLTQHDDAIGKSWEERAKHPPAETTTPLQAYPAVNGDTTVSGGSESGPVYGSMDSQNLHVNTHGNLVRHSYPA